MVGFFTAYPSRSRFAAGLLFENVTGRIRHFHFPQNSGHHPQTRSELQTGQTYPSKASGRDTMIKNNDGSIDLYYGPKAPAGKEANWTQTVPGKGWFVLFRLYGPLEPWFDKTWRPGEFELVQ